MCCQPLSTKVCTRERTGSRPVAVLICDAVTGREFSISMTRMVSPGVGTVEGVAGSGSRLSISAFPWIAPDL